MACSGMNCRFILLRTWIRQN